ncbi:hypothetical protein IM792_12255 [Mucilaginibacter sp. JRF]|uniref:hypothetical protein n=1 Tax=Mucilaginibacter sp. JRF TaxID=2780088 RepID=UPI00188177EF|nr:hypothetical protein [Mucilaginibacter sp. JRF]MBE9585224.1 hypothetical protein [Mucilaginibacter sp. JRF]
MIRSTLLLAVLGIILLSACRNKEVTTVSINKVLINCTFDKNGDDHVVIFLSVISGSDQDIAINRGSDNRGYDLFLTSKHLISGSVKLRLSGGSQDIIKAMQTVKLSTTLDIEKLRKLLQTDSIVTDTEVSNFIQSKSYYVMLSSHDRKVSLLSKNDDFAITCAGNQ